MNTNSSALPFLVDSHCHLNQLDLTSFNGQMDEVLRQASELGVGAYLCVCITPADIPALQALAARYPEVSISVGVHPNEHELYAVSVDELSTWAQHERVVAIGETGLDYYRVVEQDALIQQRQQFRNHIQAALAVQKPLIIHTREAGEDTIKLMREENASEIGGVMHCFVDSWEVAKQALDLNFYISFSGIATFKNALEVQEVVKKVPLDRLLVETDSPYLAPVPFRGKQNHPGLVYYVAKAIAELRNVSFETIAKATTTNFYHCFPRAKINRL